MFMNQPNNPRTSDIAFNGKRHSRYFESKHTSLSDEPDSPVLVGGGYYSWTMMPAGGNCLVNAMDANNTIYSNPCGRLSFDSTVSAEESQNAFNTAFSGSAGWGWFSTSMQADYFMSTQSNRYSLSLNYLHAYGADVIYVQPRWYYGNKTLSPAAQEALAVGPQAFIDFCGDSFMPGAVAGAVLAVSAAINFQSTTDKESFSASMSMDIGLASLAGALQTAASKSQTSGSLTLNIMQLGGDPSQLPDIFEKGPHGYYLLNCNLTTPGIQACGEAIGCILDYAKIFANQTQFDNGHPVNPNALYYFQAQNPVQYSVLGVNLNSQPLPPTLLWKQANLTSWYQKDSDNLLFIDNMLSMVGSYLTQAATAELTTIQNNLNSRVEQYSCDGIVDGCYGTRAIEACNIIYNDTVTMREQIYPVNQTIINHFLDSAFLARFFSNPDYTMVLVPLDFEKQYYQAICSGGFENCVQFPDSISFDSSQMNFLITADYYCPKDWYDGVIITATGLSFDGIQYVGGTSWSNTDGGSEPYPAPNVAVTQIENIY